jgi:CDP-glycerol glycerophosphotransferase
MSPVDGSALSVVILAAGAGRRLGRPFPKVVTPLVGLGTILDTQLAALRSTFGPAVPISVVVGFGADALIAACPTFTYVRNDRWEHTDTAYGLGCALRGRPTTGVLWLPGDVVCDAAVLEALGGPMAAGESCAVVTGMSNRANAVRFTLDPEGRLRQLAPGLREGLGELAGINYVAPADRARFIAALESCAHSGRAEYALALAIAGGMWVHPVEVDGSLLVDVDTDGDLRRAERLFDAASFQGSQSALPGQRGQIRSADASRS